MKSKINISEIWRSTWFRFILIGGVNFLLFNAIQLTTYQVWEFGYWASSSTAFFITGVEGFFVSRAFVFRIRNNIAVGFIKYFTILGFSYVVSFLTTKLLFTWLFRSIGIAIEIETIDIISMIAGSTLSAVVNYLGQKYITFNNRGGNSK